MSKPHPPIWPKVPPRFTAAALAGHSGIGLAFGALIYLICLTGSLSVLVDEMKLVEQPTPAPRALTPGALNRAVGEALAQYPRATRLFLRGPVTPRQRASATVLGPVGERNFLAGAGGALSRETTPFTDFVTELHMTLTAPAPWGSLLVGLAGGALLSLTVSGVLAHPRIFRDAFRLKLRGSERLREAELHNRLSVWGLPFHVAVTLTGAVFGLAPVLAMTVATVGFHGNIERVYAPVVGPRITPDAVQAPLPDLEALTTRAVAAVPGSQLSYVGLERPGTRGQRITIEVTAPGRLPRGEGFYFDTAGRQIGRGRFVSGSVGMQVYSGAAQVHFGFFGGLSVRLVYVALGAALTFVSASGVTIWLARRADRGRPCPRLRRTWLAWTWGAPAALVLAAAVSRVAPPDVVFWMVAAAIQALVQAPWRRPAFSFSMPRPR